MNSNGIHITVYRYQDNKRIEQTVVIPDHDLTDLRYPCEFIATRVVETINNVHQHVRNKGGTAPAALSVRA
ncbi:hypothetical protein [Xylella phage Cota]|uniref:Uncharacterized protein n=1 Tax=Xylella phage Cota TaxID=2699877 RepID=A0A6F8ZKV9_9CAUD|nr:hypothetical protein [Xylella phage Cota]